MEWVLPPDVIIFSRTDIPKYVVTCNPKTKWDTTIEKCIDKLKEKYPVIENVETMFKEFHALLMGKDEAELDNYLEKYNMAKVRYNLFVME